MKWCRFNVVANCIQKFCLDRLFISTKCQFHLLHVARFPCVIWIILVVFIWIWDIDFPKNLNTVCAMNRDNRVWQKCITTESYVERHYYWIFYVIWILQSGWWCLEIQTHELNIHRLCRSTMWMMVLAHFGYCDFSSLSADEFWNKLFFLCVSAHANK